MLRQKKIRFFSSLTALLLISSESQAQIISWGVPSQAIPTMSFTSMIILAGLLGIFGLKFLNNNEKPFQKSPLAVALIGTVLFTGLGVSIDKAIAVITTITINTPSGSQNLVVNGPTRVTNDYTSAIEITGIALHGCSIASNTCTVGKVLNPTESCEITTSTCPDTTPDAFTFVDITGMLSSTVYTSNGVVISGIDTASPISVTGGTYNINGGAYTAIAGTVTNGQTVTVRQTSSANFSTKTDAVLTIGGVSDTYSVTTGTEAEQCVLNGHGWDGSDCIIL